MRRRTTAVLLAALAWGLSTTALAQTSSTSSSTSTTSSTTSTSTSTTSTTVVNPCTGQPCTVDPPVATLSGSGGDVRLDPFGYCWRAPTPTAQGLITKCLAPARAPDADIPVRMVVRKGETLSLRFGIAMSPTEVRLVAGNEGQRTLTPANPTAFVADLAVGVYELSFQTKWNQGDVSYFLKVDVRAAAPTASDPRPLALTG